MAFSQSGESQHLTVAVVLLPETGQHLFQRINLIAIDDGTVELATVCIRQSWDMCLPAGRQYVEQPYHEEQRE